MKHNQNKKAGGFQRGAKNDKFFKKGGDNKFKSYKKDHGRPDNKKPGFQKHFKKDEQKKPQDKGGYRQYQNPQVRENRPFNGNIKSQSSNNKSFNDKPSANQNYQKHNNQGKWTGKQYFDKPQNSGSGKNQQKNPRLDESSGDSDDEAPVVNYCIAPNLLEQKLKKKEQFQNKGRKVDKREEYLKQKQRRNDILKQKTRKGQPVMAGRMQLLYEKVQKVVSKENEGR